MAIKHSPGCGCCGDCPTTSGSGGSYTAGNYYEIPHDLGKNQSLDLRNIFPSSLWEKSNSWGKVEFKDSTGSTLYESLEVRPSSLDTTSVTFAPSDGANESFEKPVGYLYDVRAFKSFIEYELSDATEYERNRVFKYQEPKGQFYRIKSTTAGTFDDTEGYSRSLIKKHDPYYGQGNSYYNCGSDAASIYFTPEKSQYVFYTSDSSLQIKAIRANNPKGDCENSSPFIDWSATASMGSGTIAFSDDTHTQSITLSTPSSSDGTFQIQNSELGSTNCDLGYLASHNGTTVSVSYLNVATATGDGHFQLECSEVNGLEGTTTDVRVIRTGGNSTAVDVVVAVGNNDVTLSFQAGDQFKSFTLTHDSHDGRDFSTTPLPTNSAGGQTSVNGGVFIFRDDHWEYGSEDDTWHMQNGSSQQFWKWNPFERDSWSDSDLSSAAVRAFVSMSHDGVLGQWSSRGLYMIGTSCQSYSEVNEDCPEHTPCETIFPYHTQQYEVEVTLDANYTNLSMPDKIGNLHEGCSSIVLYEAQDPDFNDYVWRFSQNSEKVYVGEVDGYETSYYASNHWQSRDNTTLTSSFCGSYNLTSDYSTYMPTGYVTYGMGIFSFANPSVGSATRYFYPTTGSTPPSLKTGGLGRSIVEARSLSNIEVTTESIGGWTTSDGIKMVRGEVLELGSNVPVVTLPSSGYTDLSDFPIVGDLGTRVEIFAFNAAYRYAIYEKDEATSSYTSDVNIYIGQRDVPTTSYKVLGFNFFGFQSNHPDLWYEVSGTASDDGFYRLYWGGSATLQSGPFSTADDGSGNTFSALGDQTAILPIITVGYWRSDWTDANVSQTRSQAQLRSDVIDDGYSRSVSGPGAGSSGTLSGTWISHGITKNDVDYYFTTSQETARLQTTTADLCDVIYLFWEPNTGSRPDMPSEAERDDFNDDRTFILPESIGIVQLNDHPDSPASGLGWVLNGTPQYTTGSTVSLDPNGDYDNIICNSNAFNGSAQTYSYWDFNTLTAWNNHVDGDANPNYERTYIFQTHVTSTGLGKNVYTYGPSHVKYQETGLTFRQQWIPCYNGMNFPASLQISGDDDTQRQLNGLANSIEVDVVTGCSFSSPQWTQMNTLGQFTTVPSDIDAWTYFGTINWEVLDLRDFNISINPYSPLWDKS